MGIGPAQEAADVISIETSRSKMELLDAFSGDRYPNEIGPGFYDIHSPRVPSTDEMVTLLRKASECAPEQIWVNLELRAQDAQMGRGAAGAGERGGRGAGDAARGRLVGERPRRVKLAP